MGKLTPKNKKSLFDELVYNIEANNSHYYAFASNPLPYSGNTPLLTSDDYSVDFLNNWLMLFGKKLNSNNFMPMIKRHMWTANTVYARYDNNIDVSNSVFYVITQPIVSGGSYHIYKCIDNNGNSPSTENPGLIGTPTQTTTFETSSDGYKWRYVATVTDPVADNFSTEEYFPVYANVSLQNTAEDRAGVELIQLSNTGIGYQTYHDGVIQGIANTTAIVISSNASSLSSYYVNNSIYIYSNTSTDYQLFNIVDYTVNGSIKTVFLDSQANVNQISPSISLYKISPQIKIESDCLPYNSPKAYSVIEPTTNSISEIVMLNKGSNITWANVQIISNTAYGSGATAYAIINPPGGHGSDPAAELNMVGFGVNFKFSNTEINTISSNAVYNKIGIIKNPYVMNANNGFKTSTRYFANTYETLLKANCSPSYTFSNSQIVIGADSNARGMVVWSNGSAVHLTGDKTFINGESLKNSNGAVVTTITINERGDIYTKDLLPLYAQNINNVTRSNNQTESFKLIIKL